MLATKCDQVEGYGEVWVISPDWANVQVQGNGFTLYGNSRMYFASRPTDGFDADAYWQVAIPLYPHQQSSRCIDTKFLRSR